MTEDEMRQRVLAAYLDLHHDRAQCAPGESKLNALERVSGVPVGHVRSVLKNIRGIVFAGNDIRGHTAEAIKQIEAHVRMPIASSPAIASQHFSVNAGDGNQIQVGHEVSGTQSMVTYQQVLEQLRAEIERSSMPEKDKKSAVQKLLAFVGSPGVAAIAALAAKFLRGG